ncbi:MAG: hypothetical protein Q7S53_05360 [bacterium]|nr:hypothetical protein [bacterium]
MPQTCEKNCYFCQSTPDATGWGRIPHGCANEYSHFLNWNDRYGKEICELHMTYEEINEIAKLDLIRCENCTPHWQWSAGCGWFCNKKRNTYGGKPGLCLSFPLHTLKQEIAVK